MGVEIGRDGIRQYVQQLVHEAGLVVHQAFDLGEVAAAGAFHHVAGQGPGTAGEADERHPAGQGLTNQAHRVHHVTQLAFGIGHGQTLDIRRRAHGMGETRPFALGEGQPQAHGVGNGEDVGKQNGCVQRITIQGLDSDFASQFGGSAQVEKAAGLLAHPPVFGQVTAGLAHHPYRGALHRFAQQGAQETVVL